MRKGSPTVGTTPVTGTCVTTKRALSTLLAGVVLCGATFAAERASAQDAAAPEIVLELPAARQGYYMSLNTSGAFNFNESTEDGSIGPVNGTMFQGRVGEMVTDWLGFGLQFGGGFGEGDGWEAGYGGLMLDAQLVWPAIPHLSFHVGFGAGGLSLTETAADTDELKGTGGAYYSASVSYDIFPFYDAGSGGFSLTPSAQVHVMPGTITTGTFVVVGLELTWWTGLDRDKLELPFDEQYKKED